jgi:multidrug efflux pump
MPKIEAITRTAEARIRPVLLTTITTMAGLAPMMFGVSLDFGNGGYTIDSPTALWWKQLATAVVFGLGIATVLTLVVTPSLLALRIWWSTILGWIARGLARMGAARASRTAQDWALARAARQTRDPVIFWDEDPQPEVVEAPEEPAEEEAGEVADEPAAGPDSEPPELTEAQGPNNASEQDEASDSDSPKPPLRAAE